MPSWWSALLIYMHNVVHLCFYDELAVHSAAAILVITVCVQFGDVTACLYACMYVLQHMIVLPMYSDPNRRHVIMEAQLAAQPSIPAHVWQQRCVALIAWQDK